MNINRTILALAVLSLGAGALYGPRILSSFAPPVEYVALANQVDQAVTVDQQARRADLIVRARVVSKENRIVTEVLPVYAEDAVTVIEERESRTPFTDVTLQVQETFKGNADSFITVLQTGGSLRSERLGRRQKFAIAGDPLLKEGSEHILFLVDISGDGVHSIDRQLYRAVNSMGRYEILPDGSLLTPDRFQGLDRKISAQLPKTEQELRQQIELATAENERGKPLGR